MFALLTMVVIGLTTASALSRGLRAGLWCGWFFTLFLLPTWCIVKVGAATLDLRTIAAVAGLACLLFTGRRPRNRAWHTADLLVFSIVVMQVASELLEGDFGIFTVGEAVRIWLLPYLVGRLLLDSASDLPRVLPFAVWTSSALALYAIVEAVSGVNLLNNVVGVVNETLQQGAGYRWGLKRSQGFVEHPLYLGYLLVFALPWAAAARRKSRKGEGPTWWKWAPMLIAIAILSTGSRGPVAAGAITWFAPTIFAWPRRRLVAMGVLAVFAGAMAIANLDAVVDGLALVAGEKSDGEATLTIGDREVEYNGTTHRFLLFEVYDQAISNLGPLGYGRQLRGVDLESVPSVFHSIDNHYLLLLLQRGYVGLGLFFLFAGAALANLWRTAYTVGSPFAELAAGLFGATLAATVLLTSVWWSSDFGSAWLFTAGLAGNLRGLKPTTERPFISTVLIPRPRFVAGHAPLRSHHAFEGFR